MQRNLPIRLVPDSNPPLFQWDQTVTTPDGRSVVQVCAGRLPPAVEGAVKELIEGHLKLLEEYESLRGEFGKLNDRWQLAVGTSLEDAERQAQLLKLSDEEFRARQQLSSETPPVTTELPTIPQPPPPQRRGKR